MLHVTHCTITNHESNVRGIGIPLVLGWPITVNRRTPLPIVARCVLHYWHHKRNACILLVAFCDTFCVLGLLGAPLVIWRENALPARFVRFRPWLRLGAFSVLRAPATHMAATICTFYSDHYVLVVLDKLASVRGPPGASFYEGPNLTHRSTLPLCSARII
jgi:hypothetical protein